MYQFGTTASNQLYVMVNAVRYILASRICFEICVTLGSGKLQPYASTLSLKETMNFQNNFRRLHVVFSSYLLNVRLLRFLPATKSVNAGIGVASVNSLGPSDAIWRWRSWSTLVQVVTWCLNQCWLNIGKFLWHSSEDIIIRSLEDTNQ